MPRAIIDFFIVSHYKTNNHRGHGEFFLCGLRVLCGRFRIIVFVILREWNAEESQLSKFQDIKYKIFTLYSQDNSTTVVGQGKKPKSLKNRLTNTSGLSIMTSEKEGIISFKVTHIQEVIIMRCVFCGGNVEEKKVTFCYDEDDKYLCGFRFAT